MKEMYILVVDDGLIILNLDLTYNNYVFPSITGSISKNINV
jgi:hypothetical protein